MRHVVTIVLISLTVGCNLNNEEVSSKVLTQDPDAAAAISDFKSAIQIYCYDKSIQRRAVILRKSDFGAGSKFDVSVLENQEGVSTQTELILNKQFGLPGIQNPNGAGPGSKRLAFGALSGSDYILIEPKEVDGDNWGMIYSPSIEGGSETLTCRKIL